MARHIPTGLQTTDELIAYYAASTGGIDIGVIAKAIPAAIDAVYEARDAGGSMHNAGAAAAIAALQASR